MIGLITPPYGLLPFVMASLATTPIACIIREIMPFIAVLVAALVFITYVPDAVLWLPRLLGHEGCLERHACLFAGEPSNTLLYFHGSGFIVGDLYFHEDHTVRLANETASVVFSVDYRLEPEHRFPAAYDDCLAAIRWAIDHIDRLGKNVAKLAFGGDSAGANLAAVVALACRDLSIKLEPNYYFTQQII